MPKSKYTREFFVPNRKTDSDYRKNSYRKKQADGLCVSCGHTAIEGQSKCSVCQERCNENSQKRKAKYTADGKCRECGKEAQLSNRSLRKRDRGNYCKQCWLKVLAGYLLGSSRHWSILVEKLDACGWRCPYTGEELVLGVNLSFDHMDPIARFPEKKHDPDNLEPISWKINLMKRDLTKSEFLALISKIHLHVNNK